MNSKSITLAVYPDTLNIAIKERMDGFELNMHQPGFDQLGLTGLARRACRHG